MALLKPEVVQSTAFSSKCCVDLEKEDENVDYGAYYYADGERRQDVMEVVFLIIIDQYMGLFRM